MNTSVCKRILIVVGRSPFPQDAHARHTALGLADAGYQVTVIGQRAPGQSWQEEYRGVQVYRYPPLPTEPGINRHLVKYSYALLAAFWLSLIVLLREGFDVIQTANPPDVWVKVALFYGRLGKPLLHLQT